MDEDTQTPVERSKAFVFRHQLIVLITGSVIIALMLVAVSMALYTSSGTAQVDLSRPGFERVREQVKSVDDYQGISATGPLDSKALEEFNTLYDKQLQDVTSVDAFNPSILSDEALGIDAPAAQ